MVVVVVGCWLWLFEEKEREKKEKEVRWDKTRRIKQNRRQEKKENITTTKQSTHFCSSFELPFTNLNDNATCVVTTAATKRLPTDQTLDSNANTTANPSERVTMIMRVACPNDNPCWTRKSNMWWL